MNDQSPQALVRRPSPLLAQGEVTHIERSSHVDADLAAGQWEQYVSELRAAGYRIHEAPPAPEHPDGVFIEDTMVVADELAVISRMGAQTRTGEVDTARATARAIGLTVVELSEVPVPLRSQGPVQLEGGDVLKVGSTVYVGVGGRTSRAGAEALGHHLATVGRTVTAVPITRTLHLKSQVTALPDGTILGYRPVVDDPGFWEQEHGFLPVPEAEGAHVIVIGAEAVLMSDAAPQSADLIRERGYTVRTVPTSEIVKLEGCVTCLSVRIHAYD